MIRPLLFLTGNQGKLKEARDYLTPFGWDVQQFLIRGEVPQVSEPQAASLEEVARAKMQQAVALLFAEGIEAAIMIEDAGLFIDAFPGFPGVYSAHVLRSIGCEGILRLMEEDRGAEFEAVAMLWDGESTWMGKGNCRGRIAQQSTNNEGFGYDPIFIPEDLEDGTSTDGQPFGAVPAGIKAAFSHRSRALRDLMEKMSE